MRTKALKTTTLLVAALVCALAFATTVGAQTVESGIVKLADANIEYFSQGQGEAVVLLPGGSFDVGYLEPLAAKLAEAGYRAVRVNPRGAGLRCGVVSPPDRRAAPICGQTAPKLVRVK